MPLDDASPEISGNERYAFTVNGVRYATNDPVKEGRDLLQKAGFNPASEHVLIELKHPGATSVGLDEEVDLSQPGREEFRAFRSDRTFNFTIDERGYEWGAPTITEDELRAISDTPENKALILERTDQPDHMIEPGTSVDLDGSGTEHIRTEQREYEIVVNARKVKVTSRDLTYAQVVALAFNPVPTGPDVIFTVTYRKGPPANPKGTLPEGGTVTIKNGMIFVVTQTNRS
ncbi:multiubiquitin domain-containing protein [Phenylobacterium sp.]|uniref:multiubiquitin domain-containing protein n=1 Tax=Phenylobacterium sp. TaxID=1871053 RepID=UPI0027198E36|nr:multiubiquitin domain-containing protein [Phenylobacterium sp.]MDO8381001.1 multiubiquitin domain-containing protein [Phenylobacterium sp.]